MDALSEVLRVIRLEAAIFFNAEFSDPWCLLSPASGLLAPTLTPREGHVIIYRLLCEGEGHVELAGARDPDLGAGLTRIPQIALDVGCEWEAAFNRTFKREYGVPPARYRRQKAGASAE